MKNKRFISTFVIICATASAVVSAQTVYWTSDTALSIQRADASTGDVENLLTNTRRPVGLALDIDGGQMYWSEHGGDIRVADLDGRGSRILVDLSPFAGPVGVALDSAGGKIYWVAWEEGVVQRANLDGSGVETLVTAGLGHGWTGYVGIALDLERGRMYWGDYQVSTIFSANLDGTDVQAVLTDSGIGPYYLTIDPVAEELYWTAHDEGAIFKSNLDGSNLTQIISDLPNAPVGIELDLPNSKLYWTLHNGEVHRANLDGSNAETWVTGLSAAWAVEIVPEAAGDQPSNVPAASVTSICIAGLLMFLAGSTIVRRRDTLVA